MDGSARPLHEARTLSSAGRVRTEIMVASSSAADARGDFLVLPVRQRLDPGWASRPFLRFAAAYCRGRAVTHGTGGTAACRNYKAISKYLKAPTIWHD